MKLNGNKRQLTQGDVNFEAIDYIPKGLQKVESTKDGYILAHGESGHKHVINANKHVELFQYYDDQLKEDCLLLKILEKQANANPCHEEHKSFDVDLGVGNYRIIQTHEFDPFGNYARKIAD